MLIGLLASAAAGAGCGLHVDVKTLLVEPMPGVAMGYRVLVTVCTAGGQAPRLEARMGPIPVPLHVERLNATCIAAYTEPAIPLGESLEIIAGSGACRRVFMVSPPAPPPPPSLPEAGEEANETPLTEPLEPLLRLLNQTGIRIPFGGPLPQGGVGSGPAAGNGSTESGGARHAGRPGSRGRGAGLLLAVSLAGLALVLADYLVDRLGGRPPHAGLRTGSRARKACLIISMNAGITPFSS